jgi:hypothetical protein
MFAVGDKADQKRLVGDDMERQYKDIEDVDRANLAAEINRLLDAIALHRREHTGGQYSDRDRKLYAAIGFTPPAPAGQQQIRKPR